MYTGRMRIVVPLLGFLLVVGFFTWTAVSSAPPFSGWGIVGLVVLGALCGFAAGYGLAITTPSASDAGSRSTRYP